MTTRLDTSGASAGPDEPAVRLQYAVQHHGQAVEQDLRREDHQHPRARRVTCSRGQPGTVAADEQSAISGPASTRRRPG